MPFIKLADRSTQKLLVTVQIELNHTQVNPQELEEKLKYLWDSSDRQTSSFNLLLMRMSKASTWELKGLIVKEETSSG